MAISRFSTSSVAQGLPKYQKLWDGTSAVFDSDYELIERVVVGGGGSSSITFSSIPSTYKHLQVRSISLASISQLSIRAQFNGDTGSNYAWHTLYGDGAGAYSNYNGTSSAFIGSFARGGTSGSTFGASVVDILDYANTSKYKTTRSLSGLDANGSGVIWLSSGLWQSTSAISSIILYPESGTLNQYTQFALYGIKGAA